MNQLKIKNRLNFQPVFTEPSKWIFIMLLQFYPFRQTSDSPPRIANSKRHGVKRSSP